MSFLCLLRQVSSVLSLNRGNEPSPDIDEAQFVTANFMAAELLSLSDVNTGNTELLKGCRTGIAVT